MPNIKRMGRTMSKMKIATEIMAQMDFDADDRGNNVLPRIAVIIVKPSASQPHTEI